MRRVLVILVILGVIGLDQGSKFLALSTLEPYEPIAVMPMVSWMLAFNTGAAFSFLSSTGDWHRWFFTMFSLTMCILLFIWMWRSVSKSMWMAVSLAMIIGGAFGNLIDRLIHGHVIDFILLSYKNYHWPVFNLADSAICLGAVILFFAMSTSRQGMP